MILAFDTSLRDLHIGLFSDRAEPLAEFHGIASEHDRGIHDALLAQKTSDLLNEIHASPKDISKIALIIGPGSFTGLRIGLSFAKGLAYGSGAEIIPLLAHKVLLKEYSKKTSDDGHQTLDFPILYPGYEKDSVYISFANDPENIRYIKISEVRKMNIKEAITSSEMDLGNIISHSTSVNLQTMAEMAIDNRPSTIDSSDSLEPFYGTDFKPTVR
jgi:tRNA threonylcarbamoyl adenosine modification protein YeaZ